ncbi:hypothetical protein DBR41_26535, partial [Pseudomonas sp. HMWF010]
GFNGPLEYDPNLDIDREVERAAEGLIDFKDELRRYEKGARTRHYRCLACVLELKRRYDKWPPAAQRKLLTRFCSGLKLTKRITGTHALLRVLIDYPEGAEKRNGGWVASRDAAVIAEAELQKLDGQEFFERLKSRKGGGLSGFFEENRARRRDSTGKTSRSGEAPSYLKVAKSSPIAGGLALKSTPVSEQKKTVENEPHLVWNGLTYEELTETIKRRHDFLLQVRIDPHKKSIEIIGALGTAEATLKSEDAKEIFEMLMRHPKIVDYKETF